MRRSNSRRGTLRLLRIATLTTCIWHTQNLNAADSNSDVDQMLQSQQMDTSVSSIVEQSPAELLNVLEQAARAGSADAALALGNRYFHGKDVVKDLPNAMRWWREASDLGSAAAAYNLGIAYVNGLGTAKDAAKAEIAFARAAEQKFPKALFAMGILRLQSAESNEQILEAGEYFRQAAERGNLVAGKNLALMYEKGIGYEVDNEEAAYWRSYQAPKPTKPTTGNTVRSINSTAWIIDRNPEHYTLQVVSGDTFADTKKLISAVISLDCAIFTKRLEDRARVVAVAGDFETYTDAAQALDDLPPRLRKNEPFIVKFQVLQRQINEQTKNSD